jgi:hypothetical protein
MGETITFGATTGYLATPELGAGPALIVLSDRLDLCDEFAAEGFTALAPDLHNGRTADDLVAAIEVLKPHPLVRGEGIGVVGYPGQPGACVLAEWLAGHRPEDVVACTTVDEHEDERLEFIRTLEFLRKHLG